MITRGKKAIRPPGPPAWAINVKFCGENGKDIAATPSSRYDLTTPERLLKKKGSDLRSR